MPKSWWPAQAALIFWLIAVVVIAWAAKAEPAIDMAKSRQVLSSEQRVDELEKRIKDLEINLAKLIREQTPAEFRPACGSNGVVICPQNQAMKDRQPKLENCPNDQFHQKCLRDRILEGD